MHSAQRALFIINPKAGRRMGQAFERRLTDLFTDNGLRLTIMHTQRRGHAKELAKQMGMQFDLVICAGGDGTLHEVVNGLMPLPAPPRLGYIPVGTFNDVAHSLGLPTNPMEAGHVIVRGNTRTLDIGCFQEDFFTYAACFGMFCDISYTTSQAAKNRIGRFAYWLDGLRDIYPMPSHRIRLEHDGGQLQGDFTFCAITNARRFGGGMVRFSADEAVLDDGLLEILLIEKPCGLLHLARILHHLSNRRFYMPGITLLHSANLCIECDIPLQWALDGENSGTHRSVTISNRRKSIRLLV